MRGEELDRYARQIILKEIGGAGQQALKNVRVLLVGAGGLGGPAGLYLAASGVGHIGIVDEDEVALSNLQRQIQFGTDDIGRLKTTAMAKHLARLNPHVDIHEYRQKINADNAKAMIADYDVVLDGTDDFAARFVVNAACLAQGTPLVSGALGRFDAQLASFAMDGAGACYQCLVPAIPPEAETCALVGVVGPLAGMIGSMMALETIKIITGAGQPLYDRLFVFDGLRCESRTITLPKDPHCPTCA